MASYLLFQAKTGEVNLDHPVIVKQPEQPNDNKNNFLLCIRPRFFKQHEQLNNNPDNIFIIRN